MKQTPMPRRTAGLKPSGQLQRKTGLKSLNPLVRKAAFGRAAPLLHGDQPTARKRPRDTGPSKDLKDQLKAERAKGTCERCGRAGRLDVHHRRGRKIGGTTRPEINSPVNLLVLCRPCHSGITVTNGNRADAEFEGLLIREDLRDPADVPVKLADGWFLLTTTGTRTPTTAPDSADNTEPVNAIGEAP
jgi:hypothetical protein